jgi:hypothetical protein
MALSIAPVVLAQMPQVVALLGVTVAGLAQAAGLVLFLLLVVLAVVAVL